MTAGSRLLSIPSGIAFADALVAWIAARYGTGPEVLGRTTVYLANQRAVRTVRDAFLRHGDGSAMVLPDLRPLGEIDEADELAMVETVSGLAGEADLAPAISPVRRQLLLTRLVQAFADRAGGSPGRGDLGQAARLAGDLARLLDSLQIEEVPFEALRDLVPERYAAHWQRTVAFLEIVGTAWPGVLDQEGALDPKHRRRMLIDRQIEAWRADPPDSPVIVAGSTGSQPATARLIEAVTALPAGAVVLPGLDTESDDTDFAAAARDATHPQHGLALLLARLGVSRDAVSVWPDRPLPRNRRERTRLIAETMRPAETTDAWRRLAATGSIGAGAVDGLRLLVCPDTASESQAIALLLREALEVRGRTAALITPDRTLARRVASELRRWGIEIDDSAGRPLADTPVMTFWRATAETVRRGLAPAGLLAALKHPLAAGGLSPGEFRRRVRLLEAAVLRGPRPAPTVDGLIHALRVAGGLDDRDRAFLLGWLDGLAGPVRDLEAVLHAPSVALTEVIGRHAALCTRLAATDEEDGEARLWRGDAGEEAASFLHELMVWADGHPPIAGADYLPLLDALIEGRSHRRRFGGHPRIAILGLIEARLQHFDLTVLGGLNEGMWPPEPPVDPWLSRPMRATVGLPPPERRIGLTAHDFALAAAAPEVVLTRAERVDGAPTVASRWLLRLETVLTAVGLSGRIGAAAPRMLARAALLDRPGAFRPAPAPAPRPPIEARPREFSVTQVETLMRDPYAIYARKVLGLEALEPLDADPGAAERGNVIHAALDRFVAAHPRDLPADAFDRLLEIGREAFAPLMARPDVWAFWWPRFERIARWFVETEASRRPRLDGTATEQRGAVTVAAPRGPVTLKAFADRIDRLAGGGYAIVDYKTGGVPRAGDVATGLAPQLPLEAVILAEGGFPGLPAGRCEALEFWQLSGGAPPGRVVPVRGDVGALAEAAAAGFAALLAAFDDEATPYLAVPDPDLAPRYNDYAHLERLAEWASAGGDGE